jgi:MoxR-like ATPase
MKPSDIASSLQLLAQIQKPAFVWGPPGVGKSQVVAQVAALLGIRLIDIRAVLLDPVDLRGLPTVEQGRAAWAIPAFLPEDGAGILFHDELNATPPLVQAACYQLLLDRVLGEYRLPDGWTLRDCGAGPPWIRLATRGIRN